MTFPSPIAVPGGQLGTAANGVLFVASFGLFRVEAISVVNTDAGAQTFNLYIRRSGASAAQRVTPVNTSLPTGAMWESGPLTLTTGDQLEGDASVAAKLDYNITITSYV